MCYRHMHHTFEEQVGVLWVRLPTTNATTKRQIGNATRPRHAMVSHQSQQLPGFALGAQCPHRPVDTPSHAAFCHGTTSPSEIGARPESTTRRPCLYQPDIRAVLWIEFPSAKARTVSSKCWGQLRYRSTRYHSSRRPFRTRDTMPAFSRDVPILDQQSLLKRSSIVATVAIGQRAF
jgi:hypothetical protein